MAALTKTQDDYRTRLDRAIQKAGLVDDPLGEMFVLLREWHDDVKTTGNMPSPARIEDVIRLATKRALGVLAWRKVALWFAAGIVIGGLCFGFAAYQLRDAMLSRHCMALYQSDVCLAIMR